jgi:C_GCAxxG_C_C family probable redox protein
MNMTNSLAKKAAALAFTYEAERGSCPQAVYAAIMETLNFHEEEVVKAADGLAGGTALSSEGTCGALVGGILAIGTFLGRSYPDFSKGKRNRRVFQYAQKLFDRFNQEYDGILCKTVQQQLFGRYYVLSNPKEYEQFEEDGAHVDKCPSVASNVAYWTVEILKPIISKNK